MSLRIEFHTIGPLYPTLLPQEVFESQIMVILIICYKFRVKALSCLDMLLSYSRDIIDRQVYAWIHFNNWNIK